ncbi:type IV pilus secretin PilQ family protein [Cupriavidus gilardii]|nr:type IV pilus secretin PilQ family protein [Cupriavidus gilardii]
MDRNDGPPRARCAGMMGLIFGMLALAHAAPLRVLAAPAAAAVAAPSADAAPSASGERLSLNFQRVDIRALLQVFADFTDLNVVASDSVQGNLTLRLKDVPWEQALRIVLDAKGLASRREGNVLWVAPRAELAARDRQELEARQQLADLEPVGSQVFQLNYQRADDVRRLLLGSGAAAPAASPGAYGGQQGSQHGQAASSVRLLSRRGSLTADARTNQLFVSDLPERLQQIAEFLARIDVPVRQVIIEARIVEADDKFSRNLGVKLGFAAQYGHGRVGDTLPNVLPGAAGEPGPLLSLPAGALHGADPGHLAVSLFNSAASRFVALELSALEADGKGKIVSSPRVVTTNNIKALIEQGTELPYQAATSSGATSVQFRKANLKLEVTPQITPEGQVLLDVDVSKDSVGVQTTQGFAIDTKHVQTQVLLENGGTAVIGGIYTRAERGDAAKVPLLGDIPVLGRLFGSRSVWRDRTELLVFLTPRILHDAVSPVRRHSHAPLGGMQ